MTEQEPKGILHYATMHGYQVVYEEGPTSWGAYVPELPVVAGAAETRKEIERLMAEAIPLHLESLREDRVLRPWLYTPELRAVFARIDAA